MSIAFDHKYVRLVNGTKVYDPEVLLSNLRDLPQDEAREALEEIIYESSQCGYSAGIDDATLQIRAFGITNRELAERFSSKD